MIESGSKIDHPLTNAPPPDSVRPGIGRGFFWMTWSGIISIGNSVVLWIFLARMRDVEELGRFTIIMGLYALFVSICSLGLMPYLVNEISLRRENPGDSTKTVIGLISNSGVFLLGSGFVSMLMMTACGFWASNSVSVRVSTMILSVAMLPSALNMLAEATAIAYGRTQLIALVSTFENVLRTVIPLVLLWLGYDISVICTSFVAVRFIAISIYFLAARKNLSNFFFDATEIRSIVRATPTFAGIIILASINWQAAVILLARYSTEAESAKYGAASRFLIPVSILMASYAGVVQPVITKYAQQGIGQMGTYISKIVRYPLLVTTIAAALSPFLSRAILIFLFGNGYADAAPTLDMLALCTIPFCLVMVLSRGLVATGSQHIDLGANALGVAACVVAGFLLIPQYGAIGAAAAQLLAFTVMTIIEAGYLSRRVSGLRVWRTASLSSACLALAYVVIWKI
ncbi:MAG: polysaccharide biosynthesis C-terminal domain-containing protein [Pyrinomonadaceae bacterium]